MKLSLCGFPNKNVTVQQDVNVTLYLCGFEGLIQSLGKYVVNGTSARAVTGDPEHYELKI